MLFQRCGGRPNMPAQAPCVSVHFFVCRAQLAKCVTRCTNSMHTYTSHVQVTGAVAHRSPKVSYKKNEVYLDIVETTHALMATDGALLRRFNLISRGQSWAWCVQWLTKKSCANRCACRYHSCWATVPAQIGSSHRVVSLPCTHVVAVSSNNATRRHIGRHDT
jgi:hypothetical protein